MWIKTREFLIDAGSKIDDFLQRPSDKKRRKLEYERSTAKEKRLAKDSLKQVAKTSKQTTVEPPTARLMERPPAPIYQQQYAPQQYAPQQYAPQQYPPTPPQNVGVWSGVKIGCGMFIVLPLIIGGIFLLIVAVPTCAGIKKQRVKNEELAKETAENEKIYKVSDANLDGLVTKEEFLEARDKFLNETKQKEENSK